MLSAKPQVARTFNFHHTFFPRALVQVNQVVIEQHRELGHLVVVFLAFVRSIHQTPSALYTKDKIGR